MHLDIGRQEIVHDGHSDVFLITLVHIHPKKLREQGVRVLVEVHVVTRE